MNTPSPDPVLSALSARIGIAIEMMQSGDCDPSEVVDLLKRLIAILPKPTEVNLIATENELRGTFTRTREHGHD